MTKVLIITYYYPPSGGSGVQRWMYFTKYMKEFGFHPYVVTVEPQNASYKFLDENFLKHVENVEVYKTKTLEPLKAYSKLVGGDARADIVVPVECHPLGIATAILDAAALSFLGLGAQPPTPEWGSMIGQERNQVFTAPQLIIFPGIALLLTVLGFNLLGDGLRDALDPRQRS